MSADGVLPLAHPLGGQPGREAVDQPVVLDTFGGRVHVEWDPQAPVTALGQLPFFIAFLKQGGVFDSWVADCPLVYTSPNAPQRREVLGRWCCRSLPAPGATRTSRQCVAMASIRIGWA